MRLTLPVKSIGPEKKAGMIKYHVRNVRPTNSATELRDSSSMRFNGPRTQRRKSGRGEIVRNQR